MAAERVYTYGTSLRRRRRDLRRRATSIGRGFLVGLAVILAVGWWFSRDTWRLGDLTPAGCAVQVCVTDLPARLDALRDSGVWRLLPEQHPARDMLAKGADGLPVPRWLANNLSSGPSYWLLDRAEDPATLLVVTRMTRVGALAMRAGAWLPVLRQDYAGGLKLFRVEDAGLYLAVRGRVLLASPSRQMLIRALTLTREQAVGDGTLESWRAQAEGADLYGGIEGSALKRMGMPLDSISGAVRFEPGHVSARLAVVPDAEWRERLKPFFSRGQNASLKEPPEGCAAISLNLGEPPLKFLQTIRELVPQAAMIPEWLTADTPEMPEDPSEAFFRRFARMLLSETGTSFRLAWLGMDVNEMIPLPIVAGLADQGAEALARMAEEVPGIKSEVSEDPPMIEWTPRAADDGAVYIRLLAGPTLSLCAVPAGDKSIAFGGSLTAARVLAGKEKSSPASSAGNGILMVRVNPGSCLEAVSAAARELAAFGWLKDMPPERLDQTLSVWHAQVGSLREIRFAVATDREDTWQVTGDISW